MPATITAEHKALGTPDEERVFEKGRIDLVNIGGRKVSPEEMAAINLTPQRFHGEWNYVIRPSLAGAISSEL